MTSQTTPVERVVRPGAASCYVALGDSFAVADPESAPGWPDLVAASLRAVKPSLQYHNVAATGASSAELAEEQLPKALLLAPDLVTVSCGADELLLSATPDIGCYASHVSCVLRHLRRRLPGAAVVTVTYPDFVRLLGLPLSLRSRAGCVLRQLNEAMRSLARLHRLPCVDLAFDRAITASSGPPLKVWREQNQLAARAVLDVVSRQPVMPAPATVEGEMTGPDRARVERTHGES